MSKKGSCRFLGFHSDGTWKEMSADEIRMFADSFIQPVNFTTEEAIQSSISLMKDTLIWIGYPSSWVEFEFSIEFEGLLKHYYYS